MNNRIVFTIVAQNYLGLANTLGRSVLKYSNNTSFYIFIADEPTFDLPVPLDNENYVIAKNSLGFDNDQWDNLSFKYNITEFCTSIKPACFQFLIDKYGDDTKIIYFDPDILVFNTIDQIFEDLNDHFLVLTPHVTTIEEHYSGDELETDFLASGIYNLGFMALRVSKESRKIIKWWHQRLTEQCFIEKTESLFTDQKWMDFMPAFFDSGILISKDIGRNVAPWNFFERRLSIENEIFFIENRLLNHVSKTPLVFFHFSGFNYSSLTLSKTRSIPNLKIEKYNDILPAFEFYKSQLNLTKFREYLNCKYSFNYFNNGELVSSMYRRLYRRLIEEKYQIKNPFDSKGLFFKHIQNSKVLINMRDMEIDKLNEASVKNFPKKIYLLNVIFYSIKSIIGISKYYMLIRLLQRFFKTENQTFLLGKKYFRNSFKK